MEKTNDVPVLHGARLGSGAARPGEMLGMSRHREHPMTEVRIELQGGLLHGRVWQGPAVPTIDGYPVAFAIGDDLTILAGGIGVVPIADMHLVIGIYWPTGVVCHHDHRLYEWQAPDVRWN